MITINCNLCNINQEKYDEIINNLDFNRLICPKCSHSDLIIHGYYTRRLKTKIGTIYLRIIRVICKACGSTPEEAFIKVYGLDSYNKLFK